MDWGLLILKTLGQILAGYFAVADCFAVGCLKMELYNNSENLYGLNCFKGLKWVPCRLVDL